MILFVSDMHFGRGACRASEDALVACLRAHAREVSRLYLLGDVFDAYIEYRRLIPKGCTRLLALLAEWTDRSIPVTYLVGNHDPWHRDYFEKELGVRIAHDAVVEAVNGHVLYLHHGDGIGKRGAVYRFLKPVLRHPAPVWLYRTLIPGDAGLALAHWVNRRLEHGEPDLEVARALRGRARRILADTSASLVVMGHTHVAEQIVWPEGIYLNTGSWLDSRTFGVLDGQDVRLMRWNGSQAEPVLVT